MKEQCVDDNLSTLYGYSCTAACTNTQCHLPTVIKKALRLLRYATVLTAGGRIAAVEGALADEARLGAVSADSFVQPTYTAMEVISISTSGAM